MISFPNKYRLAIFLLIVFLFPSFIFAKNTNALNIASTQRKGEAILSIISHPNHPIDILNDGTTYVANEIVYFISWFVTLLVGEDNVPVVVYNPPLQVIDNSSPPPPKKTSKPTTKSSAPKNVATKNPTPEVMTATLPISQSSALGLGLTNENMAIQLPSSLGEDKPTGTDALENTTTQENITTPDIPPNSYQTLLPGGLPPPYLLVTGPSPDLTPPQISLLTLTPNSGSVGVGGTITLNITADADNYTGGAITVNGVATAGFTNLGGNNYRATYTVVFGNANRSSGHVPASVVLTDAALNSNAPYTTVAANTLTINGQIANSSIQIFPTFTSGTGEFNQNVLLDCTTGVGTFVMYAISDSDSHYHFMNGGIDGNPSCPGGHQTVFGAGQKFSDYLGYFDYTGWYYVSMFAAGTYNCPNSTDAICTLNAPVTFARLHRDAAGVWSDSDN